jgi:hypothetical protein
VTTARVAAVTTLKVVGGGEDEVRAFVIKVFGEEFLWSFFGWWHGRGFGGVWHR